MIDRKVAPFGTIWHDLSARWPDWKSAQQLLFLSREYRLQNSLLSEKGMFVQRLFSKNALQVSGRWTNAKEELKEDWIIPQHDRFQVVRLRSEVPYEKGIMHSLSFLEPGSIVCNGGINSAMNTLQLIFCFLTLYSREQCVMYNQPARG